MANFALEIGLEEMPAHLVTSSEKQLVDRVHDFLDEHRLSVAAIKPFSTPRRLAVMLVDVAEKSESISEERRGPALERAKDDDGNWSKAAQGFARGQKTTPDELTSRDGYLWYTQEIAGEPAADILSRLGDEVVSEMKFSTYMKWGNHDFLYVRPIRWLVALLDDQVVDFTVLDVHTDRVTRGHRFLSNEHVVIDDATDYVDTLKDAYVLADAKERKDVIAQQLTDIAKQAGWQLDLTSEPAQDLLEEVNNIVEWPTAFAGNFDEKYLDLPDEVLITSMREHQRFFFVRDQAGKLLPHFLSVRNGDAEYLDNVVAGNEKVLVARLEDAEFFYREDQQKTISDYMERVKKLVFHEKIGTVYEHMQRVQGLAANLAQTLGLDAQEKTDLQRAAEIYKFDLMTGMVGEFDELQGIMGAHYAKLFGENDQVATAIQEHYQPTSATGPTAKTAVGAVLAIADKLDSIMTFFAADMAPTGSNDPYGLRRAASGVVRTLIDHNWHLDLTTVLTNFKQANGDVADTNVADVVAFMVDRVRKLAQDAGIRPDIVAAGTALVERGDVTFVMDRTQVLSKHSADANFRSVMEALTRVSRLAAKDEGAKQVNPDLFTNDAESKLYQLTKDLNVAQLADQGAETLYQALAQLTEPIDRYFDQTMVNDDDQAIRANRYAQLHLIQAGVYELGDLEQVVVK
ncbi:glycine--tRNA ligase subunit beta [Leuconostocaceae bacterium ESL0723]|nr:glycine--tRNA ligase subunit beta [Leuconostocaceae bacterium ESL0723]